MNVRVAPALRHRRATSENQRLSSRLAAGLFAAVLLFAAAAALGEPAKGNATSEAGSPFVFIAWNPGAVLSFLRTGFVTRSVLPTVLFNQEAGVALAGGWHRGAGLIEGRMAIGNSNATYLVGQVQVGGSWFFGESAGWFRSGGPYVGGAVRYWDLVQVYSHVQTHNLAPMLHIGWWFDAGPLFFDVRLSQVFAVATLSSVAGSRPGFALVFSPLPGISPVLPIGLVQIGVKIPLRNR